MSITLVTGGAGFIGSHLVEELVERKAKVRVIDNLFSGHRENLASVLKRIDFIKGDICDEKLLRVATKGADVVFHLAAIPSVPRSVKFPHDSNRVNVEGTLKLLEASVRSGVKRIVYSSSSSVYGDSPKLPKRENFPLNPLSPYAASKLAGEIYLRTYSELYKIETVSVRFFNVFGPRQDPTSQYAAVIPIFVSKLAWDESPPIFGSGRQTRDFTFVKDVVNGVLLAGKARNINGEAINVSAGGRTSVTQLAQTIARIMGKDIKPKYLPSRPGDVLHSYADISKAKRLLHFKPRFSLEEGLAKTINWFNRDAEQVLPK